MLPTPSPPYPLKKTHFTILSPFFIARRRVKVRYRRKFRRVKYRRRFVVRYRKRKYQIRGLLRGRCTIRVLGRPRPIIRKRSRWFVRYGRRLLRVLRHGRRRYIRIRRKKVYLKWRFEIRFKGARRMVRCRGWRWSIKTGRRKWKRIRRRRTLYIKIGRRRVQIRKEGRKYLLRKGRVWKKLRVKLRRRRGRRGRRRKWLIT